MFGQTFYFNTSRKLVAGFGTLFNNINIERKDALGDVVKTLNIPLAYAPKHRYLARLRQDLAATGGTTPSIKTTLPRMSYHLEGFTYDTVRQINPLNYKRQKHDTDAGLFVRQMNPVPWNFNFTLNVFSKNMEDGLHIIEQIIPYFQPHVNISIIDIPQLNLSRDVSIALQSVSPSDNYEGSFEDEDRILSWDFDFVAKGYFYQPITDVGVIKKFFAYIGNNPEYATWTPEQIVESIGVMVDPIAAAVDDPWAPVTEITDGPIIKP